MVLTGGTPGLAGSVRRCRGGRLGDDEDVAGPGEVALKKEIW
jgi:hypothetical protein